ncbi:hypothetical protein HDV05_000710 [Chytridiales sp. JEL 0842]|nr:hypothetical protein HDV05_000710 [Chytridiales sp. JEL 0842]
MPLSNSLWDTLPPELHHHILAHTDPLTRYLHNPTQPFTDAETLRIWTDAFRIDWPGDLHLLPSSGFPNVFTGLLEVRSRQMYERLCTLKPEFTESVQDVHSSWDPENRPEEPFRHFDEHVGFYAARVTGKECDLQTTVEVEFQQKPLWRLVYIPLHREWLDLPEVERVLSECDEDDKIAAAWVLEGVHFTLPSFLKRLLDRLKSSTSFQRNYLNNPHFLARLHQELLPFTDVFALSPYEISRVQSLKPREKDFRTCIHLLHHTLHIQFQYDRLLPCLSAMNHVQTIEWIRSTLLQTTYIQNSDLILAAARFGSLEAVKYTQPFNGRLRSRRALHLACVNGHLEVAKYLKGFGRYWVAPKTVDEAAGNGMLDVVRWLTEEVGEVKGTTGAMDSAARNGHLEVVKYLHECRQEGGTREGMTWAAIEGHVDILRWLHEKRGEEMDVEKGLRGAIREGHVASVKWILDEYLKGEIPGSVQQLIDAFLKDNPVEPTAGQFDVLEYLHTRSQTSSSPSISPSWFPHAANLGLLKHVKWLAQAVSLLSTLHIRTAIIRAASKGHLQVLEWIHDTYCPSHSDPQTSNEPSPCLLSIFTTPLSQALLNAHIPTALYLHSHLSPAALKQLEISKLLNVCIEERNFDGVRFLVRVLGASRSEMGGKMGGGRWVSEFWERAERSDRLKME